MSSLRVLGIDPGSSVTGFGVVSREDGGLRHVAHGNIRLRATHSLASRLQQLHAVVSGILEQHRPDLAAVEGVFVSTSPRAALVLGQARGAVLAALGAAGLPVREYAPARVKLAVTGSGRASKLQVQRMVARLLSLPRAPAQDAADALAAAICCAQAGRIEASGAAPGRRRRPARRPLRIAVRPVR